MTIHEIIKNSTLPNLETEIILSEVLKMDRSLIYAFKERKLTRKQTAKVEEFIKRREKQEPLAYIFNKKEFFGLEFYVDKKVLIPRPETEELVEKVLVILRAKPEGSLANASLSSQITIVEVGTGSGCISISLAKHLPQAKIYAIDVSKEALEVAKINAQKHNVHINFLKGNLLEPVLSANSQIEKIDFILTNLPYIPTKNYLKLEKQIKDYEPKIALDSGENAMTLYNELFKMAESFIRKGTKVFYELDGEVVKFKKSG